MDYGASLENWFPYGTMGSNPIPCATLFWCPLVGIRCIFYWMCIRLCILENVIDRVFCIDQDGIWFVLGVLMVKGGWFRP